MREYIFSTEVTEKDLENYKIKFADYLECTYQLNDISELSEAQLVESFKSDMQNAGNEFDRTFHYYINRPALVCAEKDGGFLVIDIAKDDIYNSIELCTGKRQEFFIENGEFKFDGTNCGEMIVRFAKNGNEFLKDDFIAKEDIDTFTEPVGEWLQHTMNHWKNELTK